MQHIFQTNTKTKINKLHFFNFYIATIWLVYKDGCGKSINVCKREQDLKSYGERLLYLIPKPLIKT